MDAWTLVRILHVVALAFFVGGQLMLVVTLVVTGAAMASHFARWQDDVLRAKLALVVLIGVLIGLHVAAPTSRALSVALFLASLAVVWLGVELTHGD